jgi:hypothetical protein
MCGTRGAVWSVVVLVAVLATSLLVAQENRSNQLIQGAERPDSSVRALRSSWIDIAAHLVGARDSIWRTDVVVFNRSSSAASVELRLHLDGGTRRFHTTVPAFSSMAVDDVVGRLGVEGKGPLEVRSDQPVTVHGRTYSVSESGTVGQFVDAYGSEDGLEVGESGWLSGLRQLEGEYRSNVCITNTGPDVAEVRVHLYTRGGFWLMSFTVFIEPGEGHHELQPFLHRRCRDNIACGCVRVEVVAGSGILASASVIDQRTNDAFTVPMKR